MLAGNLWLLLARAYRLFREVYHRHKTAFFLSSAVLFAAVLYVSADGMPLNYLFLIPALLYVAWYSFALHREERSNHLYLVVPLAAVIVLLFILSPYFSFFNALFGVIKEWFGVLVRLYASFRDVYRAEGSDCAQVP